MTKTPHPAVAPLLDATRALAGYRPTSHADLARLLRDLHDGADGVLPELGDAISAWGVRAEAELWTNGELINLWLEQVPGRLEPAGEAVNRARLATGHWDAEGDPS